MKHNQIKQKDGSVVYPLTNTMFDYFPGQGFKNWGRFRIIKGHVVHVAGTKYPTSVVAGLQTKHEE